jgi:hypothetical protein
MNKGSSEKTISDVRIIQGIKGFGRWTKKILEMGTRKRNRKIEKRIR